MKGTSMLMLCPMMALGVWLALAGDGLGAAALTAKPEGQLTIAFDTTIAPTYLDPAETMGIAAPFVFLYALHDALVKPLPGNPMAPCLAESWTESSDGLVYEFKLREGLTFHMGEAVGTYLGAVGIRTKVRTMERAAFLSAWREKELEGLILTGSGAFGNAATRLETYALSTATYAYGGHADLDELFRQQALERDRTKREALRHQLQRLMQERVMHAPSAEPAALHGVGPRVEEPGWV